jgi:hypothetical protein
MIINNDKLVALVQPDDLVKFIYGKEWNSLMVNCSFFR